MDLPTPYTDHWLTDSPPNQNHSLSSQSSLFCNWNLPSQSHIKASDHSPRPPVPDPIHSPARQQSGRREEDGRRSLEGPTYSRVGAELWGGCGQTLSNQSESEVSILGCHRGWNLTLKLLVKSSGGAGPMALFVYSMPKMK